MKSEFDNMSEKSAALLKQAKDKTKAHVQTAKEKFKNLKPMAMMLVLMALLLGLIAAYKLLGSFMMKKAIAEMPNIVTVSTTKASYQYWQPKIKASASFRAVKGVEVTASLAGMVTVIHFVPGQSVNEGDLLVELNAEAEIANLQSLEASADLAEINYKRDKAQYEINGISKSTLDADAANVKNTLGQVAEQKAIIAKKRIRAPFSGRLGISNVNPGQYINPGDKMVTLQALNPLYIDFYVPQQLLSKLKINQEVSIMTDVYPLRLFKGKITTIDPRVDPTTRNVPVEATLDNADFALLPGIFSNVEVWVGSKEQVLTLPQTAISYNPYGEIVYIVKEGKNKQGKKVLVANQSFVKVGEVRGDQVAVLKGLQPGEEVVTSGQLKLQNGSEVKINNSIEPKNDINPKPINE